MEKIRLECDHCEFVTTLIPDESVNGNYEIEYCPACGGDDINIEEIREEDYDW